MSIALLMAAALLALPFLPSLIGFDATFALMFAVGLGSVVWLIRLYFKTGGTLDTSK